MKESTHPEAIIYTLRDIPAEISRLRDLSQPQPGSRVPPQSYFWLVNGINYLGTVVVRHRATGRFVGMESHLYFEIRPSERGKGYGTLMLALALIEARKLGLDHLFATAEADNLASIAVIENNGGKLVDRRLVEENGRSFKFLRFSIPTVADDELSLAA